jgi:hypothetical protein
MGASPTVPICAPGPGDVLLKGRPRRADVVSDGLEPLARSKADHIKIQVRPHHTEGET